MDQNSKDKSGSKLRNENKESGVIDLSETYVFKIVFTVYPSSKSDQ